MAIGVGLGGSFCFFHHRSHNLIFSQPAQSQLLQIIAVTMKAISSKSLSIAALLAALLALFSSVAEAGNHGGLLTPRSYHYSRPRDPFDLVSEIFRAPIYFNSLMKQQQEEAHRRVRSTPRYAVSEENNVIQLEIEVPGISAKDIVVELEDDKLLRIKGTRKYKVGESVEESEFDVSFQLSDGVNPDKLTVKLSAGILRVQVPKQEKITKKILIATDAEDDILEVKAVQSGSVEEPVQTLEGADGITIIEGDEA